MPGRDEMALLRDAGMRVQPGLATAWPEIVGRLNTIYRDKVAMIPWLPAGWLDRVLAENGQDGDVILPQPALGLSGQLNPGTPVWLDTAEKRQAWTDLALVASRAVASFAAQKADEGRAELNRLYVNATFWDAAYRLAKIAALPAQLAEAGAKSLLQSNVFALAALVVGVVLYVRSKGKR